MLPTFYEAARREIGVKETPGSGATLEILDYAVDAQLPFDYNSDEVPWCAVFANAMLERSGYRGTRTAWARDFLSWGKKTAPREGCVVVLTRDGGGHVGFFVRFNEDRSKVCLLGGNQHDMVCEAWFPTDRVLGYRMPEGYDNDRPAPSPQSEPVSAPVEVPVYPAPMQEAPAETLDRLRRAGSRTVRNADNATFWTKLGIGGIFTTATFNKALDWFQLDFVPALHSLKPILDFLKEYQFLVLGVLGVIISLNIRNILHARVDDDQRGLHIGRKEWTSSIREPGTSEASSGLPGPIGAPR